MSTVTKKHGGTVFPVDRAVINGSVLISSGLSLRDYFAAKAMHGLIVGVDSPLYENLANMSYRMADAMLAEREKEVPCLTSAPVAG